MLLIMTASLSRYHCTHALIIVILLSISLNCLRLYASRFLISINGGLGIGGHGGLENVGGIILFLKISRFFYIVIMMIN